MKKFLCLLGVLGLMALCKNSAFASGILYTDTIVPIIGTNMQTDNIKNLKKGEAQVFSCLGIIETGHAGIQNAAKRAGITQIHHVDVKTKMFLGIGMITVQVYGE